MSINANELRIGNWVELDWDGQLASLPIYGVVIYDDYDYRIWFKGYDDFSIDSISPIPLTPELLHNIGFKQGKLKGVASFDDDGGDKDEYTYYWDLDIKQSEYVDGFSMSLVKWGKKQEYFTFSFQNLRVRFKYLHQLQNLYFALTQKELPITNL